MSDKNVFEEDRDTGGGVTVTRKGSDYDTGRKSGNYANASTMMDNLKKGKSADNEIKSAKRYAKNSKNLLGTDADYEFFKHTEKGMK